MIKPILALFISAMIAAPAIQAADTGHGGKLHQQHCTRCHDDGVYKRDDRRVTTMEGLRKQVQRCELSLGLKWFDEDINDVTGYLNESYYRF